ncbi:uracil-DNA glycosylase family protein [Methylogaea oryzae]|nr:uracil-DNA glycosylase family protein [Methylogaea oryzae]
MIGPVVSGLPVLSPVMLVGQAPGAKEGPAGKPFAWTAGKTLFRWFASVGLEEERFRQRVYMAAVCRCFPGKNPKGGDRPPSPREIESCGGWLQREIELLQPRLVLPVGKMAIALFLPPAPLAEQVGRQFRVEKHGIAMDVIPLPHPSGASPWHRMEPGLSLLRQALQQVDAHPAWRDARTG